MQNEKQKLKLEAEVLVRLMCIGGKAERRSHSWGGFRGELPGAPSQAVTDSSLEKKNTREPDEGGRLLHHPIITPAENPCGFFGFPKSALTYFSKCCFLIHQNILLVNCSQIFCNYPIYSFSFHCESYRMCLHA